jgi:UPF0755 protein
MDKSRLCFAACFIFFILYCFASMWFYFLFTPAISQDGGVIYYLRPGTTKKALVLDLSQRGVIKHPTLFSWYIYMQKNTHLKAGEYQLLKGATPVTIWQQMTRGTGLVYHPFTIIPGWTFAQLRYALTQADALRQVAQTLTDKQIMLYLGYPNGLPEGQFFPDTYYYTRGVSDLIVLQRAFILMQKKLKMAWQKRASDLPYLSEYQVLIAASLIEKEAHLSAERPIIAGVLVNRLRRHMLLQFDPTVIYGLGQRYDGKIRKQNLQENTAYNTYRHKGLPPTPIAMPSLDSIQATLHPEQHHYLYFVARGDGGHQFSTTLSEHNIAIMMISKQSKGKK